MNAGSPEDGPITIDLPRGGFEAVQGIVFGLDKAFHAANGPDSERLGVKQDFILQQVASEGILSVLDQMNVAGAAALAGDLRAKVNSDPYTDMLAVETGASANLSRLDDELSEHQEALAAAEAEAEAAADEEISAVDEAAMIMASEGGPEPETQSDEAAILQLEEQIAGQQRYMRLAGAVGAVARATVAVLTGGNPEAIQSSVDRARATVEAATEPVRVVDTMRIDTAIGDVAASALISMLDKLKNPPLDLLEA